jgi:hypothetical protein
MQFGCGACADIIHVSAHPVAPSDGMTAATGFFSLLRKLTWYGHAVPMTMLPLENPSVSSVVADQYLLISGRCCFMRSTTASSCVRVSS